MRFKTSWSLGAFAAAALLTAPVMAQDFEPDLERELEENNLGLTVRGGLNSYTGDIADATAPGAFLGIQLDTRPVDLVGVEVGYTGARNPFEDINGALWRHNVGALAKVGPQLGAEGDLRPFVGAGLGVSVLNPTDDAELIGFDTDFVTEIPLAAGAEYRFDNGIVAGARATYSILGGESIGVGADGNVFNLGAQVGGRF